MNKLKIDDPLKIFDKWFSFNADRGLWSDELNVINYRAEPIARTAFVVGYKEGYKAGRESIRIELKSLIYGEDEK